MFIRNILSIISSDENIKSITVSENDYDLVCAEIKNINILKHDSHLVIFLDAEGGIIDVHNIPR